jgi:hypothetical protein
MPITFKKGDPVNIELEGRQIDAIVVIVNKFGKPGMVTFDGFIGGYLGMMPIQWEEDQQKYTDLIEGREIKITPIQQN